MKKRIKLYLMVGLFFPLVIIGTCSRGPNSSFEREVASVDDDKSNTSTGKFRISQKFNLSKLQLNLDRISIRSPQFAQLNPNLGDKVSNLSASQMEDIVIPSNTELVALVDNECIDQARLDFVDEGLLSASISTSNNRISGLKVQAVSFVTNENLSMGSLSDEIENDNCVIGVSENGKLSIKAINDPDYTSQNHHLILNTDDSRFFPYESSVKLTKQAVIAIVDTGVDYNHPDLDGVMWRNAQGNVGRDFINGDDDPDDDNGHGTHCAGISAAETNNGIGVAGVIHNHAKIMAIKALDQDGSGSFDEVANGILWAANNGADVISLSLSGTGQNAVIKNAIQTASQKALVVMAAGNNDQEIDSGFFVVPAAYASEYQGALSVGSFDSETLMKSSFSNYSTTYVDILAPGAERTGNNSRGILSTYFNSRFARLSGTSMATPMVAAAGALVVSFFKTHDINYTPSDIEEILLASAVDDQNLGDVSTNGRRLDLKELTNYLYGKYLFLTDGGMRDEL